MATAKTERNRGANNKYNAKPDKRAAGTARARLWEQNHPQACRERSQRMRDEKRGKGVYAQMLDAAFNPIDITVDKILLGSDCHFPFYDSELLDDAIDICKSQGIRKAAFAGDMWDCDSFSKFLNMTPPINGKVIITLKDGNELVVNKTIPMNILFEEEAEEVKKGMKILLNAFDELHICRGNHEKRWMDICGAKMGIKELFRHAIPSNMSEDKFFEKVHITGDDHMYFTSHEQRWLHCHPRNFRGLNLSVVRDLAMIHHCNVNGGHGHQFARGRDKSGRYEIVDGGGFFDKESLAYLRETSCHATVCSGFYILNDGYLEGFEGR
jgi:hypothetical protein